MLSQAFACRVIGVGQLLRGEVRAERPRGLLAYDKMAAGELLEDSLVLGMLQDRLTSSTDIIRNGWLLDGFPRTQTQAKALLSAEWDSLRPDAVILIDRPDELIKEFSLGYENRDPDPGPGPGLGLDLRFQPETPTPTFTAGAAAIRPPARPTTRSTRRLHPRCTHGWYGGSTTRRKCSRSALPSTAPHVRPSSTPSRRRGYRCAALTTRALSSRLSR